jgi:hypothetical protein
MQPVVSLKPLGLPQQPATGARSKQPSSRLIAQQPAVQTPSPDNQFEDASEGEEHFETPRSNRPTSPVSGARSLLQVPKAVIRRLFRMDEPAKVSPLPGSNEEPKPSRIPVVPKVAPMATKRIRRPVLDEDEDDAEERIRVTRQKRPTRVPQSQAVSKDPYRFPGDGVPLEGQRNLPATFEHGRVDDTIRPIRKAKEQASKRLLETRKAWGGIARQSKY